MLILRNQQIFSENLTNKEIEINETILAVRSENAQQLQKIRLLETKSPPNNDSNELILYQDTFTRLLSRILLVL